jgi:hypothetical protein
MDKEENEKVKWYLRPLGVLVLLFVVLGPLALPLLYKSPKFNKTLKIILTIAVIIYTSYLIFVSVELGIEVYRRLEELQNTIG